MALQNRESELTEEKLKEEIDRAKEAWIRAEATEPRAESVFYEREEDVIIIKLKSGVIFSFPPKIAQGLGDASPEELSDFWISSSGRSIHWDSLDVDFGIPELVAGIFGTKAWMAELGQKGGQMTSKAKAEAARKNGKKGGRPKRNAQSDISQLP